MKISSRRQRDRGVDVIVRDDSADAAAGAALSVHQFQFAAAVARCDRRIDVDIFVSAQGEPGGCAPADSRVHINIARIAAAGVVGGNPHIVAAQTGAQRGRAYAAGGGHT